jgi:hypothetical protein
MSRDELKKYNNLKRLLKFAYGIPERDTRIRAVGRIQSTMAQMMGEN